LAALMIALRWLTVRCAPKPSRSTVRLRTESAPFASLAHCANAFRPAAVIEYGWLARTPSFPART
jgi:hypothetical protein